MISFMLANDCNDGILLTIVMAYKNDFNQGNRTVHGMRRYKLCLNYRSIGRRKLAKRTLFKQNAKINEGLFLHILLPLVPLPDIRGFSLHPRLLQRRRTFDNLDI